MRISDWSSDVCSSDLKPQRAQRDAIEALASEIGVEESFASDARPEAVATSGRRRRGVSHSPVLGTKSMAQMLWDAACQVRGAKDAPKDRKSTRLNSSH